MRNYLYLSYDSFVATGVRSYLNPEVVKTISCGDDGIVIAS
jgi:hypothetical protein